MKSRFLDVAVAAVAASTLVLAAAWAQTLPGSAFRSLGVVPGGGGAFTADGAYSLVQSGSRTAYQIYGPGVGFAPGYTFFGNMRSTLDIESGTTDVAANAYDAYVYNDVPLGAPPGNAGAGFFSLEVNAVAGASSWGLNTTCIDSPDSTTGHSVASTCIGYENDFVIYNNATTIAGIDNVIEGPATGVSSSAYQLDIRASSASVWTYGFVSSSGAASTYGIAGALAASGTNISSQPLDFGVFDSAATGHYVQLSAGPYGTGQTDFLIKDNSGALPNFIYFVMSNGSPEVAAGGTGTPNLLLAAAAGGTVQLYSGGTLDASFSTLGMKLPVSTIAIILGITCNSGSEGSLAYVKDTVGSAPPTWHATLVGGGSTTVNGLVSCNGTNWQYE